MENVSENVSLELWPNATYHFSENASALAYLENVLPVHVLVTGASGQAVVSSPAPEKLEAHVDWKVSLSPFMGEWMLKENFTFWGQRENLETWLSWLDNNPGLINTFLLENLEGRRVSQYAWIENKLNAGAAKLPVEFKRIVENLAIPKAILQAKDNLGHIVVEDLTCTTFLWDYVNYELEVGLTVTLDNVRLFEGDHYRSRLPLTIDNISFESDENTFSLSIEGSNEDEFGLDFEATRDAGIWDGTVRTEVDGTLPRTDDEVRLKKYKFFEVLFLPRAFWGAFPKVRKYWLDDSEIVAKFRAPEPATVVGLPDNFRKIGTNVYRWDNENAIGAFAAVGRRKKVPEFEYVITEVFTVPATDVTTSGATLRASIEYGNYDNVDVRFRYRRDGTVAWSYTPWTSNYTDPSYSKGISGLNSGTAYEFQAIIGGEWWFDRGGLRTFTTSAPPPPPPQQPPVADADGPYSVVEGRTVELDGTGSSDPDGIITSYSWTITSDPTGVATLTDSDTATPVFHAPRVDSDTDVTVGLTVTDDDGATDSDTATATVLARPPAPPTENIEAMPPENAALVLAVSEPESSASSMENLTPETAGRIIDSAVEAGLTDNFADILNLMDPAKASSARHSAGTSSAASVTEAMARENTEACAKAVDRGGKKDVEREAEILNEVETVTAADILMAVFELPETPRSAAALLGSMNLDRSTAVVQTLITREKLGYIDGMFGHLGDGRLNAIYGELTVEQRGEVYPPLSADIKDRISADLAPRFEASDLTISKKRVEPGETNSISAKVTNTGGTPHTYTVEFLVKGEVVDTRDVRLDPRESEAVSFEVIREREGTYGVEVDGLTGSFEVRKPAPPPKPFPWEVVIPVIIGIIVVAAAVVLYWRRRS